MVEGKKHVLQLVLWPSHEHHGTHVHTTHTNTWINTHKIKMSTFTDFCPAPHMLIFVLLESQVVDMAVVLDVSSSCISQPNQERSRLICGLSSSLLPSSPPSLPSCHDSWLNCWWVLTFHLSPEWSSFPPTFDRETWTLASCPSCPQRPPVTFMSLGAKLLRKSFAPQLALAWVWPHPHAHWAMSTPTLEFYYPRYILPGLLFRESCFCFPLFSLQTPTHQWDHSWTFYIEEEQHVASRSPTGQSQH